MNASSNSTPRTRPLLDGLAVDARSLSAEERAAFAVHAGRLTLNNWPKLVVFVVVVTTLWWPLDLLIMSNPAAILRFAGIRGAALLTSAALLGLARAGIFDRDPFLGGGIALFTLIAIVSYGLGCLGPANGPWFGFTYVMPLFTIPMLLSPWSRLATCGATAATAWAAYLAARPDAVHNRALLLCTSFLVFVVAMAAVLGHAFYLLALSSFVVHGRLEGLNRGLESRVAAQSDDLRRLAHRTELAREEERKVLAGEIHDGLGQELTALRYAIAFAARPADRDAFAARLGLVSSILDRSGETMRRILESLRPRVLEELGLIAAVRWLVDDVASWSGLVCSVDVDVDVDVDPSSLDEALAVASFRSLQEALQNVARHAKATRVAVAVTLRDATLSLQVTDDGIGMPEPLPASARSLGLIALRERALALSSSTVSNHLAHVREKLGASSNGDVIRYAHRVAILR